METLLLDENQLDIAVKLITSGEVVGIPTETVYGLGADASNENAVRKIFQAKGRPADNPLIVHLADFSEAEKYTRYIPEIARKLAEKFMPGALTIVLPKNEKIPLVTSGGLDTVGIRVPAHPVMHRLIELTGRPVSAPSANKSGYPSPTTAQHVMRDMDGIIPAVIDGGECQYGVESTVISVENEDTVRILRPGCITPEMLGTVSGNVIVDKAVLEGLETGEKASSPGMKYKHYSPSADIVMIESDLEKFTEYVGENYGEGIYCLIFDGDRENFPYRYMTYGKDSQEQAQQIFRRLRELDDCHAVRVYVRSPEKSGVGLAVYNRLIRSAGFEVIRL
ncbi:MAG: threonylcarbamoyl-AMP synthase [Ruminococcus sp.]|nr:threonylcarbamoyl-AMP synthase [Ruminococcus sp.]